MLAQPDQYLSSDKDRGGWPASHFGTLQVLQNLFCDNGSTCNLISRACAQNLKLSGRPVNIFVETINKSQWISV